MGEAKRKKQPQGWERAPRSSQAEVALYVRNLQGQYGLFWWMEVDRESGDVYAGPPHYGKGKEGFRLTQHISGVRNLHTDPLHMLKGAQALGSWTDRRADWSKKPMGRERAKESPERIERVLKSPPGYVLLYAIEPGHGQSWDAPWCIEVVRVNWTTPRHYEVRSDSGHGYAARVS
jgi:hypothetical protein